MTSMISFIVQIVSSMQPSGSFLDRIVARYDWLLTFAHSPAVTPLLSTNDPPSSLRSVQLNASIEIFNAALPELQGELDTLQRTVTSLEAQMSRLLSLKRECESILSPFRRLPPEMLMEILRCSWTTYERYSDARRDMHRSGFNVFTIERGPWYLGHVCRSWRDTVENLCPDLWSNMTIEVPPRTGPPFHRAMKRNMVALLERVLERTRGHQLDFYFKHYSSESPQDDQVMAQCFSLMLAHSGQWRRTELVITSPLLSRILSVHGKVDWLEELYLTCNGDPIPTNINAFEVAPRLKILHLENMHRSVEVRYPTANLVSLFDGRRFDGRRFSGHDVTQRYLHVIASSPNLVSFSWHHHSHIPVSSPPYYPLITHLTLEELSASSGKLLRSLRLPALTQMALRSGHEDFNDIPVKCPPDALSELHGLLVRSQCSLTSLSLVDAAVDEHLFAIIVLCPRLRDLSVEFNGWAGEPDTFMASLVRRMSETQVVEGLHRHILVPDLEYLDIKLIAVDYNHISFIDREFVEMITSRVGSDSHNSSRLKSLALTVIGTGWDCDLVEADFEALNALNGNHSFHLTTMLDNADRY
ncbi:hypothetical protein ARMGADRAFT_1065600 [Armillaria gallica]|uniref:F-box domain-containing protein n=1 Tax=Armillaria gallica TaxID=47427 RepID=A0A2H3CZC5_ARMGA|nr:hypothetical protein ARMGADRAFT_1065600 [Armillaria gallica]